MKISLRKANAIQNSIQSTLKSINLKSNIEISEFQDPIQEITIARELFLKNDQRRNELLIALYHIRGLVGRANASSEISDTLSKIAYIDKRIQQLEQISSSSEQMDLNVIKGKLEKLKNAEDRGYGRDYVSTSIISAESISNAIVLINSFKKEKLALSDKVLELNIKTEITIEDIHVETLKNEGIL